MNDIKYVIFILLVALGVSKFFEKAIPSKQLPIYKRKFFRWAINLSYSKKKNYSSIMALRSILSTIYGNNLLSKRSFYIVSVISILTYLMIYGFISTLTISKYYTLSDFYKSTPIILIYAISNVIIDFISYVQTRYVVNKFNRLRTIFLLDFILTWVLSYFMSFVLLIGVDILSRIFDMNGVPRWKDLLIASVITSLFTTLLLYLFMALIKYIKKNGLNKFSRFLIMIGASDNPFSVISVILGSVLGVLTFIS